MTNEPWKEHPGIWKDKKAFFNFIRGLLRKGWSTHPTKIEYIKNNRFKIDNPNPKGRVKKVWGGKCEMCENTFVQKELQVDHIEEAGALNDWEDLEPFARTLLGSTSDNYQLLCLDCHSVKTMAVRYGITLEEARKRKKQTFFSKLAIGDMKESLKELGVEEEPKTKKRAKEIYKKVLEGE
jgi:hypothetical protein